MNCCLSLQLLCIGSCSLITHLCDSSSTKTVVLTFSLVLWSVLPMLLEEGSKRLVWSCHSPAQHCSAAPDIPQARPKLLGMAEETPSRPFQACRPCLCLLIRSALAIPIWVSCVLSLLYLTGMYPLLGAFFLLHYTPFIRPLANRHLQADAASSSPLRPGAFVHVSPSLRSCSTLCLFCAHSSVFYCYFVVCL